MQRYLTQFSCKSKLWLSENPIAADNQQGRLKKMKDGEKSELLSKIEVAFNDEYAKWQHNLDSEARTREEERLPYNDPGAVAMRLEAWHHMGQTRRLLRIISEIAGVELILRDSTIIPQASIPPETIRSVPHQEDGAGMI